MRFGFINSHKQLVDLFSGSKCLEANFRQLAFMVYPLYFPLEPIKCVDANYQRIDCNCCSKVIVFVGRSRYRGGKTKTLQIYKAGDYFEKKLENNP